MARLRELSRAGSENRRVFLQPACRNLRLGGLFKQKHARGRTSELKATSRFNSNRISEFMLGIQFALIPRNLFAREPRANRRCPTLGEKPGSLPTKGMFSPESILFGPLHGPI